MPFIYPALISIVSTLYAETATPPRITCGFNSSDSYEQVADCDKVLGKKARLCSFTNDYSDYPFDCDNWDKMHEEGFQIIERGVAKYDRFPLVMVSMRESHGNQSKDVIIINNQTDPKTIKTGYQPEEMCGQEGIIERRIEDCKFKIRETTSVCMLNLKDGGKRIISCDMEPDFTKNGLVVHKWQTVAVGPDQERVWYHANTKTVWSANTPSKYLIRSYNICSDPEKAKPAKAGIENMWLASCNALTEAVNSYGARLVWSSEMLIKAKMWCDSQANFYYFDGALGKVKENRPIGSPSDSIMCTKTIQ